MWKDIPDWENLYEINENGEVRNKKTLYILTPDKSNTAGYLRITLYQKERHQRFLLHRLVALLFIENPHNLPEINHIDGDKYNCKVENLEWCTRTFNEHDKKKRIGLCKPFIIQFADGTEKLYEWAPDAAKDLNVSKQAIKAWLKGKCNPNPERNIKNIAYIKA